jgi:serine/threonine protein kinase
VRPVRTARPSPYQLTDPALPSLITRQMSADPVQKDPFGLGGALLDGRFRIHREVAEGGFGVVYFATQVALDRPVAIKVLKTPAGFDEAAKIEFRDRFASEAKTIARIHHPNIVDVYDFGISPVPSGETAPWMALEWLEGETLEDQLVGRRGRGGQSAMEVLAMFRPILQAFAYAHKQGIVHRDIKPSNIMAVPTENGMMMRVLDFGIAKVVSPDEAAGTGHTKTNGIPAFSPLYAAPEQIAFGRTGPWTDVHALGLILTELLTDQPPYLATDMQLFEQIIASTRPTPRLRGIDVGGWEPVLKRAVALSPSERWRGAADLLAALDANLGKAEKAGVVLSGNMFDANAATQMALAPEAPSGPSALRSTSETALEVAGMRAASRRNRGWLMVLGAAVLIGGLVTVLAFGSSRGRKSAADPSTAALVSPAPPPPIVPPASPVVVPGKVPEPSAPRPLSPPTPVSPVSAGPEATADVRQSGVGREHLQRRRKEVAPSQLKAPAQSAAVASEHASKSIPPAKSASGKPNQLLDLMDDRK